MQNKVVHAAEKKAFELVIDSILKNLGKDTSKNMVQLINMAEKILGDTWSPSAYDMLRNAFSDPEGKWVKFGARLLNEVDHDVFKKAFMTLGYEGRLPWLQNKPGNG